MAYQAKKGFDVHGIDFSETAIAWAKENCKKALQHINFKVADVTNLSLYYNATFDVIYDESCRVFARVSKTDLKLCRPNAVRRFIENIQFIDNVIINTHCSERRTVCSLHLFTSCD
ncbi:MAG: class I SAM-dependent methyltransferase [Bdellovibrionota bacterium]